MNLIAVSLFLAAAAALEDMYYDAANETFHLAQYDDRRYPSCNIIKSFRNEKTGEYHAQHKCKTMDGKFKCSELILDRCVHVDTYKGTIMPEDWANHHIDKYRTVTQNCHRCTYYGYSMSLYCLCGRGIDPDVFNWSSLELDDVLANNDGILANNEDSSKTCVSKEIDCP